VTVKLQLLDPVVCLDAVASIYIPEVVSSYGRRHRVDVFPYQGSPFRCSHVEAQKTTLQGLTPHQFAIGRDRINMSLVRSEGCVSYSCRISRKICVALHV
jgi:hypothetical protein